MRLLSPVGAITSIIQVDEMHIYRKSTPIAVKGALIYNHYLKKKKLSDKYHKVNEGDKVKFLYLSVPNPYKDR